MWKYQGHPTVVCMTCVPQRRGCAMYHKATWSPPVIGRRQRGERGKRAKAFFMGVPIGQTRQGRVSYLGVTS